MKAEIAARVQYHLNKKHGRKKAGVIPVTDEARALLAPWKAKLESLDGKTIEYEDTPKPGIIYANHDFHRSLVVSEEVWWKALGDALAQSTEDRRLVNIESGNALQSEPVVLDARVAQKVIDTLKGYGIKLS